MPLPRVGVLCAISGLGGAELSLLELVTHLRDSYEFHLIVPGEGTLRESAELAGAKVWVLPWPEAIAGLGETANRPGLVRVLRSAAGLRSFARRLSELLDEIGPSAFVTNATKAHVIGALTRRRKNVPLIWYMRDGLEDRVLSRKLLFKDGENIKTFTTGDTEERGAQQRCGTAVDLRVEIRSDRYTSSRSRGKAVTIKRIMSP